MATSTVEQYCQSGRWEFSDASDLDIFDVTGEGPVIVDQALGVLRMTMPRQWVADLAHLRPDWYGAASTVALKNNSMRYGTVTARYRASGIPGAVSTLIMIAPQGVDGRDEIDLEWLGGNRDVVSTNVFAGGHVVYAVNGLEIPVNETSAWHEYTVEWTPEHIKWSVDRKLLRTRFLTDSWTTVDHANLPVNSVIFPIDPLQIQIGLWDSGRTGVAGTIAWCETFCFLQKLHDSDYPCRAGGPMPWHSYLEAVVELDYLDIACHTENPHPTSPIKSPRIGLAPPAHHKSLSPSYHPLGTARHSGRLQSWN